MRKGQSGQAKKAQARTSASPSTHSRQARRICLSCLLILAPAGGHAGPSFAQLAAVWRGSRAAVAGFRLRDGETKVLLQESTGFLVLAALDEEVAGAPDEPVPVPQDQELDAPPEVAHGGLAFICSASRLRGGRGGGGGGTRSTGAGPRAIRV